MGCQDAAQSLIILTVENYYCTVRLYPGRDAILKSEYNSQPIKLLRGRTSNIKLTKFKLERGGSNLINVTVDRLPVRHPLLGQGV